MIFEITAVRPQTGHQLRLIYDNETNALVHADTRAPMLPLWADKTAFATTYPASREMPQGKASPRVLKISLGLSCNYSCEYCSQRFVPHAGETNKDDIQPFLDGLDAWVTTEPQYIQFWGGEPLVYIKTLKPLAEALRVKYPKAVFSVITNGSLLNPEVNAWLDRLGFAVGVSHDGPGQPVRGPDPLQDEQQLSGLRDLYERLAPQGRISFNAMMNAKNVSRAAVQAFFVELTGDPAVVLDEGGFIDAYDAGGLENSLDPDSEAAYRNLAFHELRTGQASNFRSLSRKIKSFVDLLHEQRPTSSLGQKCGMDRQDSIAVDLRGNVLTCQNVSSAAVSPNGQAHKVGHVSDLGAVKLDTSTHWSKRDECPKCPVVAICQGSCMYLEGPLWEASCNNAFSDAVPVFAAAIELLTGYVPTHIKGPHREDRWSIWEAPAPRKVIPIVPTT